MRSIRLVCFSLLFFSLCLISILPLQARADQPVTIALPASALYTTIKNLLPLPIEPESRQFQGTITLDSISKLAIKTNVVSLQGMVSGHNMRVTTNIGGQDIQLKLGKLVLPVTCDIAIRYNKKQKTLFLTPHFQNPTHGQSNSAKTLLPLLNGLGNKEYPVKLDKLSPFQTRVGSKNITVQMEPVNIQAAKDQLIISLRPVIGKHR
jgi:hypothetical protein